MKKDRYTFGNIDDIAKSESFKYDVEAVKSSEIVVYPEQLVSSKSKKRSLDKTLYEAFMLQFWHELLNEYQKNGYPVHAPALYAIQYERAQEGFGTGTVFQTWLSGEPLSRIHNDKDVFVEYRGEKTRIENAIAHIAGILTGIKELEGMVHSDLERVRHLIFDAKKPQIGLVDFDNSYAGDPFEENIVLEKAILERYNHPQARTAFHDGRRSVRPLNYRETARMLAEKEFLKCIAPYNVRIDPVNMKTTYLK